MAEKNGLIEKTLNINYLNVQKQELEVEEKASNLLGVFSKNTATHVKSLKAEQKEVVGQKKDTKAKYKSSLDGINANYGKHLDALSKSIEEVESLNAKELESAESLKDSEDNKLNKTIEKIEKEYIKQV